jgi:hypothetical protein
MKSIFLTLALLSITIGTTFSQTKMIAHKSHSGKNKTFNADFSTNNFGIEPTLTRVDSIRKISKSTIILYTTLGADTVNDPKYASLPVDSLRKIYSAGSQRIKFIGFEKKKATKKPASIPKQKKSMIFIPGKNSPIDYTGILKLAISIFILLATLLIFQAGKKKQNTLSRKIHA